MKSHCSIILFIFLTTICMSCSEKPEELYKDAQKLYDMEKSYEGKKDFSAKNPGYDLAIEKLDEAIEINPDYAEAYFLRGKCRLESSSIQSHLAWKEKFENAYKDFETANFLFTLSGYSFSGGKWDSIEKANLKEEAMLKMADACTSIPFTTDFHKAKDIYEDILLFNPKSLKAVKGLAVSMVSVGDVEKSLKPYDKLIELEPNNAEYYFSRGMHNLIQKINKPAGCNDLLKARELYDSPKVYENKDLKNEIETYIGINCGK